MMASGSTTYSTDTAAKLGMKARLSSKVNTIKEKKMATEDTNGPTVAITKVISSTACSKVKVSFRKKLHFLCRHILLRRVREDLRGTVCTEPVRG